MVGTALRAFTVVELLVVITIIVVLLALLAPAVDKAVYQAELAACAAKQRGITSGIGAYAMSYRRAYPNRFINADASYMAGELYHMGDAWDDRPKLMPFVPLKMFLDPLCGKVDLSAESNDNDTVITANYDLYFGLRFYDAGVALRGMMRLGDRLAWGDDRFDVLVMDHDRTYDGSYAMSSHPDTDGKLAMSIWQSTAFLDSGIEGVGVLKFTVSRWDMVGRSDRGPVDVNVARSDGSVQRFNDFARDQWQKDPRVSRVPNFVNGVNWPVEYNQVPLE